MKPVIHSDSGKEPISFFKRKLQHYVKLYGFDITEDEINERAGTAEDTFEQLRRDGKSIGEAMEIAGSGMFNGLWYSNRDLLKLILEQEFYDDIPEEMHDFFVDMLLLCPDVIKIFSKVDLSDPDFYLDERYDDFYNDMTGVVTAIICDTYGL